MQNTFKRIIAFALMICMLFCVVPMMAFAEETEPAQLDHKEYDFNLKAYTYSWETSGNTYTDIPLGGDGQGKSPTDAGANFAQGTNQAAAAQEAVAALYEAGTVGWKYHSVGNITSTAASFGFAFGKTDVNYNLTLTASNQAGAYFAMTIKSPGTGDYKLTLDYFTHNTGASQASVYVLPASVTDIVGALEYYEALGTFSCYSTVSNGTTLGTGNTTLSNSVSMKAGKEYILVFTNDAVSASRDDRASLYLGGVALDLQAPAQNLDTIAYNFDLDEDTAIGTADISRTTGAAAKDAIDNYYEAGTLNWKYHSVGNRTNGTAASWNFTFANRSTSKYDLYLNGNYKTDVFFATTIRSPGTGNYAMTLNYFTHTTGATKGSVYVLPGNTANVAAALDSAVAVGSFSCKGAADGTVNSVTFDNPVSMEAGAEYLLVFTADEYYDATAANKRANLFPSSVVMNRIVSLDEIEYKFALDTYEFEYTSGGTTNTSNLGTVNYAATSGNKDKTGQAYLTELYEKNEDIHWHYHSSATNGSFRGNAEKGVYMNGSDNGAGYWFAIAVRSPGPGSYTATMKIWDSYFHASKASVYLLPADTADIAAAVTAGTGKLTDYECDGANSTLVEESRTFDITFGTAEKYLLVFKNDALSETYTGSGTRANLYLKSIVLTNKAAGGEEEETGVFVAEGKAYADIKEAVRVALDDDQIITLNDDYQIDELQLLKDVSLDLNGNTLTAEAYTGAIVDSSDGNTGLLKADADAVVFNINNADIPLYDANSGAYRFFDYTLEPWPTVEPVGTTSQKFWFKFHFRVSDAEGAELDQDAYDLVAAGGSDFQISTELTWNGEALDTAFFGKDGDVDAFSQEWATGATASRWLYVVVNGLGSDMEGTLTVRPVLWANGVRITNGALSYTCGAEA